MVDNQEKPKYQGIGLSLEQVSLKRQEHGEKLLPEVKAISVWFKLFQQFNSPLIFILLGALSLISHFGYTKASIQFRQRLEQSD